MNINDSNDTGDGQSKEDLDKDIRILLSSMINNVECSIENNSLRIHSDNFNDSDGNSFSKARKRVYSDINDDRYGMRRSTREIKRPKFDDELVDSGVASKLKRRTMSVSEKNAEIVGEASTNGSGDVTSVTEADHAVSMKAPSKPAKKTPRKEEQIRHPEVSVSAEEVIVRKKNHPAHEKVIPEDDEKKTTALRAPSKDTMCKELAQASEAMEVESKDLKLWPAEDDVALISAISHVHSIETVYQAVNFTREYDIPEIQERWYKLLYDENLSKQAKKRISELSPECILRIQSRIPFSQHEEDVLTREIAETINRNGTIRFNDFVQILEQHRLDFHSSRTAQILSDYNRKNKLRDVRHCSPPNWERIENGINLNNALCYDYLRPLRNAQVRHRSMADRPVLINPVLGITGDKINNSALAAIKGRVVRFVVISDLVTIGRSTAREKVDVDLSVEGPVSKISRKQAILELDKEENVFRITNIGQRSMFIDGKPLPTQMATTLQDHSVIEVASIRLIFKRVHQNEINPKVKEAIPIIRKQAEENQLKRQQNNPGNQYNQQRHYQQLKQFNNTMK